MAGPHHRTPHYRRLATIIRTRANNDPLTRCWRCGQLARHGDPWTAGHTRDGDNTSPILPEHRSCNSSAGAQAAAARRRHA